MKLNRHDLRILIESLIYEIRRPIKDRIEARKKFKKQMQKLPAESIARIINIASLGLLNFEVEDIDELSDEEFEKLYDAYDQYTKGGILIEPTKMEKSGNISQKIQKFFGSLRSDEAIKKLAQGRRQLQTSDTKEPMEIFEMLYDFKLGSIYQPTGGQKLRLIPKQGVDVQPITYVINPNTEQILARIPGVNDFIELEFDGSDQFLTEIFRNQLIIKWKKIGGSINESLSRGSLYRKRYYGRY